MDQIDRSNAMESKNTWMGSAINKGKDRDTHAPGRLIGWIEIIFPLAEATNSVSCRLSASIANNELDPMVDGSRMISFLISGGLDWSPSRATYF